MRFPQRLFPESLSRFAFFSIAALCSGPAWAQAPESTQVLRPFDAVSNPIGSGGFGHHLAHDGNTLVVGALQAAYVYEQSPSGAYQFQARLQLSGTNFTGAGLTADGPGYSDLPVVIDNDLIVATSVGVERIHVFERNGQTWNLVRLIEDQTDDPGFGSTLALQGSTLVIGGAYSTTAFSPATEPGKVWTLDLSRPDSELVPLIPSLSSVGDRYGKEIELSSNLLVVSAPLLDQGEPVLGAIFVFERDSQGAWVETQVLSTPGPQTVPQVTSFGREIHLSGGRLAVRSGQPTSVSGPLRLEIYERTNSQFFLSDSLSPLFVGSAGVTVLATAFDYDRAAFVIADDPPFTGQVGTTTSLLEMREFEGQWSDGLVARRSGEVGLQFDNPVEFIGRSIAVGHPSPVSLMGSPLDPGSVEIHSSVPRNIVRFCDSRRPCQACPCGAGFLADRGGCGNSSGTHGKIETRGEARVSTDTLGVGASDLNPSSFALLLVGMNQLPLSQSNCQGFNGGPFGVPFADSKGLRCVGGNLRRLGIRVSDVNGDVGFGSDGWGSLNGAPTSLGASLNAVPGQALFFQVYYRDLGAQVCSGTLNTTDAAAVVYLP